MLPIRNPSRVLEDFFVSFASSSFLSWGLIVCDNGHILIWKMNEIHNQYMEKQKILDHFCKLLIKQVRTENKRTVRQHASICKNGNLHSLCCIKSITIFENNQTVKSGMIVDRLPHYLQRT